MDEKISIIIPTYNEKENIIQLIEELTNFVALLDYEIIVVDDNSPDKTTEVLLEKYGINQKINILKRENKLGLSSAILHGINNSKGSIIIVMDADFSHPPKLIPLLIQEICIKDLVIASRYTKDAKIVNWPIKRRIMSYLAKSICRPITSVKDPLSGYFIFRKKIIENVEITPRGFKILLEFLLKSKYNSVSEIPFVFENRKKGFSKMTLTIILQYFFQLKDLYIFSLKAKLFKPKRSYLLDKTKVPKEN